MKFSDSTLNSKLITDLAAAGFVTCNHLQEKILPGIARNQNLCLEGIENTGKSTTLALAALQQVYTNNKAKLAIIMVPNKDSADKMEQMVFNLSRSNQTLVGTIYSGISYSTQEELLKKDLNLLIGTPDRILDSILSGMIAIGKLSFLGISQLDTMEKIDLLPDVEQTIKETTASRPQILITAAHYSNTIQAFLRKNHLPVPPSLKSNQVVFSEHKKEAAAPANPKPQQKPQPRHQSKPQPKPQPPDKSNAPQKNKPNQPAHGSSKNSQTPVKKNQPTAGKSTKSTAPAKPMAKNTQIQSAGKTSQANKSTAKKSRPDTAAHRPPKEQSLEARLNYYKKKYGENFAIKSGAENSSIPVKSDKKSIFQTIIELFKRPKSK